MARPTARADRVKIPIRNLYYLLLYAWGYFQAGPVRDVGIDDSPDLPNLFAKVLCDGTRRLLRRGLDRGYRSHVEETRGPRGRLLLNEIIKRQTLMRGQAVCEVDELTHDVLHNQILLATLRALANCPDVDRDRRHELRVLAMRFIDVSDRQLTADLFHRVQLSRNSAQYGLLIRVCEFVFWSLMPDEQGAQARFQNILDDELRMSALFEEFLRNFYRAELPNWSVAAQRMEWDATADTEQAKSYLPSMLTDITLRSPDRVVIADAKYYRNMLAGGQYQDRLRSGHLYQMVTYLAHASRLEPEREVSGLLIYPQVGEGFRARYELLGFH
jgi:5-methylcytosine-specific restriction enzyme subunit McrC